MLRAGFLLLCVLAGGGDVSSTPDPGAWPASDICATRVHPGTPVGTLASATPAGMRP